MVVKKLEFRLALSDLNSHFMVELGCRIVVTDAFLRERICEHINEKCVYLKQSYGYGLHSEVGVVVSLDKFAAFLRDLLDREYLLAHLGRIVAVCSAAAEVIEGDLFFDFLKVIVEEPPILAKCVREVVLGDLVSREGVVVKGACIGVEGETGGEEGALRAVLDNAVYVILLVDLNVLVYERGVEDTAEIVVLLVAEMIFVGDVCAVPALSPLVKVIKAFAKVLWKLVFVSLVRLKLAFFSAARLSAVYDFCVE